MDLFFFVCAQQGWGVGVGDRDRSVFMVKNTTDFLIHTDTLPHRAFTPSSPSPSLSLPSSDRSKCSTERVRKGECIINRLDHHPMFICAEAMIKQNVPWGWAVWDVQ